MRFGKVYPKKNKPYTFPNVRIISKIWESIICEISTVCLVGTCVAAFLHLLQFCLSQI